MNRTIAGKYWKPEYAPVGLAALPFFASIIQMLVYTRGNLPLTVYLITEIGVTNIWLQGAASMLYGLSLIFLTGLTFFGLTRIRRAKKLLTEVGQLKLLTVLVTAFMTLALVPIGYLILISFIYTVQHLFSSKRTASDGMNNEQARVSLLSLAVAFSLITLTTFPSLPMTVLTLQNNDKLTGEVFTHDSERYIIKSNGRLQTIMSTNIKSESICNAPNESKWYSRSIARISHPTGDLLTKCEVDTRSTN